MLADADFTSLLNALTSGVAPLLAVFLIGFWRKWWVMGSFFEDCQREKEEWKARAMIGTKIAEHGVETAEKLARNGGHRVPPT